MGGFGVTYPMEGFFFLIKKNRAMLLAPWFVIIVIITKIIKFKTR